MRNELSDRQQAIRMRLAGETTAAIYRVVDRTPPHIERAILSIRQRALNGIRGF